MLVMPSPIRAVKKCRPTADAQGLAASRVWTHDGLLRSLIPLFTAFSSWPCQIQPSGTPHGVVVRVSAEASTNSRDPPRTRSCGRRSARTNRRSMSPFLVESSKAGPTCRFRHSAHLLHQAPGPAQPFAVICSSGDCIDTPARPKRDSTLLRTPTVFDVEDLIRPFPTTRTRARDRLAIELSNEPRRRRPHRKTHCTSFVPSYRTYHITATAPHRIASPCIRQTPTTLALPASDCEPSVLHYVPPCRRVSSYPSA